MNKTDYLSNCRVRPLDEDVDFGQPRFEPHVPKMDGVGKVTYAPDNISNLPEGNNITLMGSNGHDISDANKWIKAEYPDKVEVLSNGQVKILNDENEWITYVWHHHENGVDLIPIPSKIHNTTSHSGGYTIKNGNPPVSEVFDYNPDY